MSQELGYQSYIDQPRVTARLIVAGIGLLLAGLCGVCLLAVLPFSLSMGPTGAVMTNPAMRLTIWLSEVIVLFLTFVAIWTGIACFLGKRWVRPIILIFSVVGLAIAVPTLVGMGLAAVNPPAATPSPNWATAFGLVFAALFDLGFPLAYFLMFRPQHVEALLSKLDPKPRWTDAIPVPLLGMILVTLWLAIQLPTTIILMPRPTLFSLQLSRAVAAIPMLCLMVAQLISAIWLYRRRVAGWWLAVGTVMLLSASNLTNLIVHGSQLYSEAFGKELSDQMAQSPMGTTAGQIIMQSVMIVIHLSGAIWVKRCCLHHSDDHSEHAIIGSPSLPL